ncbi:MAG TPA: hypothetical protein VFG46_17985 [Chryseolinea sp.]|jgi:hypothetical protein|nr:hypothetical protein [Chryseolinea sp.]
MKTLKNVLLVNALSSGATGLGLIAFAAPVAILFGISEATPVIEVGVFLFAFAILVFREGRRTTPNLRMVKLIIILDISWVLVSLLVVVLQLFYLTPIGYFGIGAVALWVAGMAYLQINGIKRLTVA